METLKCKGIMNNFFVKKVGFAHPFRCFNSNEMYEFRPGINLIVGDQGCGKSSLFYAMLNWQESGIAMDYEPNLQYRFFDTEKMNPRFQESFKSHEKFENPEVYDKKEFEHTVSRLINRVDSKSHGEVLLPILLELNIEGYLIKIDEPESGLSIRSQFKLFEHYKKLSKTNQLFIATHSLVFINSVEEVLSLEHKKWMKSTDFVSSQNNP